MLSWLSHLILGPVARGVATLESEFMDIRALGSRRGRHAGKRQKTSAVQEPNAISSAVL